MSLSQRERQRKREAGRKPPSSVFMPKIPYYGRFRVEQILTPVLDRDELEVYPEDATLLTENVIRRTFARCMVHDGRKWVRQREALPYGTRKIYYKTGFTVPAGTKITLLDVCGKGWFQFMLYNVDYEDMIVYGKLDGVGFLSNDIPKTMLGYNFTFLMPTTNFLLVYDNVNSKYITMVQPFSPLYFESRLTFEIENPDTADHTLRSFEVKYWLAEGKVVTEA